MIGTLSLKGEKILITGGAGLLGSTIAKRCLAEGASVIVFDNLSTGRKENIAELLDDPQFTFVFGDCNRHHEVAGVFLTHRPTYVFHYAAVVGVKRTVEQPFLVFEDITGIKNVFEHAALCGVKKLLFASF